LGPAVAVAFFVPFPAVGWTEALVGTGVTTLRSLAIAALEITVP